jgi:5,10-methylenetetrahydrofolate reductase
LTAAPRDLLRARLARQWTLTVEAVTPAPDDETTRARILTLADAVRDDDRVAALSLTDRTASLAADPVALAPHVLAHAGAAPLVHLAGKGRDTHSLEQALDRCVSAGVGSVLLTGGDALPPTRAPAPARRSPGARAESSGVSPGGLIERSEPPERAGVSPGARDSIDMLRLAGARVPELTRVAVVTLPRGVRGTVSWERAAAKRDAGADAFVAQVSWDLSEREIIAEWQTRLGAPILGAVMLLTRGRLTFLAEHGITGIVVPPALRARIATDSAEVARRRLALDLVLLRRLGYAGAHVTGILTPALLAGVLDDADRLNAELGDDWRRVWREAAGIA